MPAHPAVGAPLVGLAGIVEPGASQEVGETIAVDVGEANAAPHAGARLVVLGEEGRRSDIVIGHPRMNLRAAPIGAARIQEGRSHDDVGVAVAVDVAGGSDRPTHPRAGLVGIGGEDGRCPGAGGGSVVHPDVSFIVLSGVVVVGAQDDVGETIGVDVAGGRHRVAQVGVGLIALP